MAIRLAPSALRAAAAAKAGLVVIAVGFAAFNKPAITSSPNTTEADVQP